MKRQPIFAIALLAAMSLAPTFAKAAEKTPICCPCCQPVSNPKAKAPRISEKNFVALQYDISGGYAGVMEKYTYDRDSIDRVARRPVGHKSVRLSTQERAQLVRLLNEIQFPKLVGTYEQKGLYDGFHQDVTLTLRNGKTTRIYRVKNYGDNAPKPFYKLIDWLNQKQREKFTS